MTRHPRLELLEDWYTFRLLEDWTYQWINQGRVHKLTVPAGTVTDLASVPKLLRIFIGRFDLRAASIPHDFIYRHAGRLAEEVFSVDGRPAPRPWTRKEADRLMGRVMRDEGVVRWRRRMAYRAVRLGGWWIWRRHKASGT